MAQHIRPHALAPDPSSARIILAHKGKSSYSPSGLGISGAQTAKALRSAGLWAESWTCSSPEDLQQRLRTTDTDALLRNQPPPSHVIIAALWISTELIAQMAAEHPHTLFVLVSHSTFGFLGADPHAVRLLREAADLQMSLPNVRLGGNCLRFTAPATQVFGVDVTYVPNLIPVDEHWPPARPAWAGEPLRLGLFGAARLLKSGLNAAAAACLLATRMHVPTELYVSVDPAGGGTMNAIEELTDGVPNVTLVEKQWIPWPELLRLSAHMHLVLQPSYTETFNCVAAEATRMGVPVVGSEAIDWLPARYQAQADDAADIARVAESLLRAPNAADDARQALLKYAKTGLDRWRALASVRIGGQALSQLT